MSDAADFLIRNAEIRTSFLYFKDRPDCTGISWVVGDGDTVNEGDVLCTFRFGAGPSEAITSPIGGRILRTHSPAVAELPHRPSQLLVLLDPAAGP